MTWIEEPVEVVELRSRLAEAERLSNATAQGLKDELLDATARLAEAERQRDDAWFSLRHARAEIERLADERDRFREALERARDDSPDTAVRHMAEAILSLMAGVDVPKGPVGSGDTPKEDE